MSANIWTAFSRYLNKSVIITLLLYMCGTFQKRWPTVARTVITTPRFVQEMEVVGSCAILLSCIIFCSYGCYFVFLYIMFGDYYYINTPVEKFAIREKPISQWLIKKRVVRTRPFCTLCISAHEKCVVCTTSSSSHRCTECCGMVHTYCAYTCSDVSSEHADEVICPPCYHKGQCNYNFPPFHVNRRKIFLSGLK